MEELIAMLMDLLMLKQNRVQSMELGENGVTGKHALHLAMADNKSENVSVTAPSHNMAEMTVPMMAHQILTPKNVTPIDAQFVCTKAQNTLDKTTKDRTLTRSTLLMTVTKILSPRTKKDKTCRFFTFRAFLGGDAGTCQLKHWRGNANPNKDAISGTTKC